MSAKPVPCFLCGELPRVESFMHMDMRHRIWTCLCPNKCFETNAYYDREGAVDEWNAWNENEGVLYDEDWDEWE